MLFECRDDQTEYKECTGMWQCLYGITPFHGIHQTTPLSKCVYFLQKAVGEHYLGDVQHPKRFWNVQPQEDTLLSHEALEAEKLSDSKSEKVKKKRTENWETNHSFPVLLATIIFLLYICTTLLLWLLAVMEQTRNMFHKAFTTFTNLVLLTKNNVQWVNCWFI